MSTQTDNFVTPRAPVEANNMRHQRQEDERQQKRVNGEVTRRPSEQSRGLLSAIPNKQQPENNEQEGIITTNNGKSLLDLQQSVSLDNLHIRGISQSIGCKSWNIKVVFLFIIKFNVSASRKDKKKVWIFYNTAAIRSSK